MSLASQCWDAFDSGDYKEAVRLLPLLKVEAAEPNRHGWLDVSKDLITQYHCDPHQRDNGGKTCLHYAAQHDCVDVMRYLIDECHCDPMAVDSRNRTALHHAASNDSLDVIKYLINECNLDLMAADWRGLTPLHCAAAGMSRSAAVEYLLSTGKCDPLAKDSEGRTPLKLAKESGDTDTLFVFKKFGGIKSSHPIDSYVNVLLVGNAGAGKSTLSHVINDTATGYIVLGSFRNVGGVVPCTAGIIPYKLQHRTLGNIILHDFAGHPKYYSSHSSVIANLLQGSGGVFLIVVNILEKEAVKHLHQWLTVVRNEAQKALNQCHVIVIVSHVDEISNPVERRRRKEEIQKTVVRERCDSVFLDCRKLGGSGVDSFFNKLSSACESIRSTSGRNLSLYCYMMYGLLEERKKNILTLSDIMSAGKDNDDYFIPDKREDVLDVLHSLHSTGLIVLLESKRKVWVVVNKAILLTEVDGILFAPETFKEHFDIASNTGIVSVSGLTRLFPQYDPDMLICFLRKNMRLCQKLKPSFLRMTNLITGDIEETGDSASETQRRGENLLFFPCLLSTDRPDEMTSQVYQFGWCLQCTSKHHFFPPQYFHALSLHLASKFLLSKENKELAEKLSCKFKFWSNGLHWFNGHGVESLVEIVDESQCVLVMVSCEKGYSDNMVSLRRDVIGEVMSVYKKSCPSLEVKELVIDPKELAYPVNTPRERTVYSVKAVLLAVVEQRPFLFTTGTRRTELKEILPDESLSDISNLSLLGGRGIKEVIETTEEFNTDATTTIKPEKIEKWLKEGTVELKVTRINMHGLPGAGKTCSRHLLLNEDPPSSTDSTSIACPAVKATRISVDDKNKKWERVEVKDLYNQLASHLKEVPNETELEQEKDEAPLDLTDIFDSSDEDESDDETDDQPTEIKPIEKKPVKIKQTEINPTETEVVKEVLSVHETGKSKKFSTNWVYFIDSGGQPAYRELLPLFTRAAALNIITIDLTKGLDEKCEFQYRISQNTSPINTELKYSNRDIIHSTIASEAMLNPIEIPYVTESDMPKHSHYLILGTRKELISEEKLKEMNKSLIEYKVNKKVIPHNKRQDSIIFPVDTLLPAGSKEREEASIELCTAISNCGVEMTIVLPIRLLTFEISLQIEAKKKKRSFLTKEEVIEIGKSLQLDKKSDIDVALQYLHNVTIILYFHEVLPTIIFVDPKPILDVFSRLIAITYVDHNKLHLIANPTPSPDERRSLIDFGLFKEGLLKVIGKQIFSKDFQPSHMITLLRHLHIIAKVENRKEGDYFFPCALPSYDKLNPASTEIQPLLIAWEINNSGTKSLAIPQGLFPLTIVHLLEREDVDFNERFYRCLDAMSLCVNDEYTINIINRCTHIEIRFYDDNKYCPQIRKLVEDAIKISGNDLKVSKKYTLVFAFKCPKNEQSYCIVKEDNSSTRCKCQPQCKVLQLQGDDDSYRCWFSDSQSSSPGKASLEDPLTKRRRLELSTSELFRSVSARLARSISSCLTTVSMNLNARSLIAQELHDEMINGRDIDSKKAPKLVNAIQSRLNADTNPESYLNEVCSALKDVGEEPITDIVNQLEKSATD